MNASLSKLMSMLELGLSGSLTVPIIGFADKSKKQAVFVIGFIPLTLSTMETWFMACWNSDPLKPDEYPLASKIWSPPFDKPIKSGSFGFLVELYRLYLWHDGGDVEST